jgi:hypothetical protein
MPVKKRRKKWFVVFESDGFIAGGMFTVEANDAKTARRQAEHKVSKSGRKLRIVKIDLAPSERKEG